MQATSCRSQARTKSKEIHGRNAKLGRDKIGETTMRQSMTRVTQLALAGCTLLWASSAYADPVKLRIGYGTAAEEQLWLLIAKPDIGKHYGKAYTIEGTRFTGSDKRAQAFEARAIDLASSSANGVIFGAAQGVEAKIIASLTRESTKGFSTTFYSAPNSPIKAISDLKGKTIGINGFSTSGHLWLKVALEKAGLSESDVTIVPVAFPAMTESLLSRRIDVGQFPQPFDALLRRQVNPTRIFSAKDSIPYDEELLTLIGKQEFLKKNAVAIRALLDDLRTATRFYLDRPKEARQILLDTKMVRVPADVFLIMDDYYRDPTMRVDIRALEVMQDGQVRAGFQKTRADLNALVDNSYLPN
jgi:ABC-type nitrate/sulfonate/bicarbonate transport system substrate-binding protein